MKGEAADSGKKPDAGPKEPEATAGAEQLIQFDDGNARQAAAAL